MKVLLVFAALVTFIDTAFVGLVRIVTFVFWGAAVALAGYVLWHSPALAYMALVVFLLFVVPALLYELSWKLGL